MSHNFTELPGNIKYFYEISLWLSSLIEWVGFKKQLFDNRATP